MAELQVPSLSDDEEQRLFLRVMAGGMGHVVKLIGNDPNKEISKAELIQEMADLSAGMIRDGVRVAYEYGYRRGLDAGRDGR